MKKITILALHLGYGGIERAISMLANSLISTYEVTIVSTYKLYDEPPFALDDKIQVKYLIDDMKPNRNEFYSALKKLKIMSTLQEGKKAYKILKQKKERMIEYIKSCDSDIIISTRDIHNKWLSKYGSNTSLKIGWEHNHHNGNKKYIRRLVTSAQGLDYFVLVSKELTEFYTEKLKNTNCKCVYIPNSIDYFPEKKSPLKNKNIVSVGRLSKEKGYEDLIEVYNIVHSKYPDWTLNIIGDGVEREKLERKIEGYGLEKSIILHGYQNRDYINEVLRKSSIYVMSSYTESFGIVLLEAYSFGIPAVSFTSAQGACEIITDNWDGYLVKNRDKEQMAKRICELISNYNRRFIMGKNASKKVKEYDANVVKEKWIEMMEK